MPREWRKGPTLCALTGLQGLTDAGIAMLGALCLFVLPIRPMTPGAQHDAFIASGLIGLAGLPTWMLVLAVTALVVLLTEITSNTAVTTT